jgi:hypothetical protein
MFDIFAGRFVKKVKKRKAFLGRFAGVFFTVEL